MATKKQHYVPQLHLRYFATNENEQHIFVLEKSNAKMWKSKIMDVAEENYFYKLNITKIIKSGLDKEQLNALNDVCIMVYGKLFTEFTEKEIKKLDYMVEDYFAKIIEPKLKFIMEKIISNTYSGNKWVIDHCFFINEEKKCELSWLLAKEFIRTKYHRDQRINMLTELQKKQIPIIAQFYGIHLDEIEFNVSYSKEQERFLHADEIFDEETACSFAGIFNNHIWILLENFTDELFCCSDNLFTLFPTHKLPELYGYGLATHGMTIWYPISSKLMLVMLDRNKFGILDSCKDRRIFPIYEKKQIENINYILVASSYKYSFFSNENTAGKCKAICETDKNLRTPASLGHVS